MIRESTKEEPWKDASKSKSIRISLTIRKSPRGQVRRSEVVSEESVPAGESNGITENGSANSVSFK